jgi:hypothetical protein
MKRLLVVLLCLPLRGQMPAAPATPASAITTSDRQLQMAQEIASKAAVSGLDLAAVVRPDPITGASAIDGIVAAWLLDHRGKDQELLAWMEQRTDLQVGANPVVGGTSAALRASAPSVLSIAVDMGMLSQTTNGQLVTFRGTPAGIAQTLAGWEVLQRPWDRLSGAATFDRSRDVPPGQNTFRQLASWSVDFELVNARRPRSAEWLALLQGGEPYLRAREALVARFSNWPELRAWQKAFADRIDREASQPLGKGWISTAEAMPAVERIARDQLDRLKDVPVPADLAALLDAYSRQLGALLQARNKLRTLPRTGPVVSLDWTSFRPQAAPVNWAATLVAQTTLGANAKADFVANLSFTSARELKAAAELSIPTRTGFASISARAAGATASIPKVQWTVLATWNVPLTTGLRVPVSLGLAPDPVLHRLRFQTVIGVQWSANAAASKP